MSEVGYCTLEDVRRALRMADLPGDISQDEQIAVDAITAETEPLERSLKRHFYEPQGITEADAVDIPTAPKTRDDEESIPTGGAHIVGEPVTPKTWQGSYTRIELARRYAESIDELLVRAPDGYEDWVASDEYAGGMWPDAVGDDYYLRINNGGLSQLYLDTANLLDEDGEPLIGSYSNAVYVTFTYGHEGIPSAARRAVALRAAAEFAEEATVQIPENATVYNVETKADRMREKAGELLEEYGGAYEADA